MLNNESPQICQGRELLLWQLNFTAEATGHKDLGAI
jgi:hypothetical protein